MKFNWNQTGMPVSLVSGARSKNEFAEFKSVLCEAGYHVMQTVDAESMARELVESGGRNIVEMVRELTMALQNTEKELEASNRRYEQLIEDLNRRGISIAGTVEPPAPQRGEGVADSNAEWEEWDRRFRALLDS